MFYFSRNILFLIIPTDELIFFREVAQNHQPAGLASGKLTVCSSKMVPIKNGDVPQGLVNVPFLRILNITKTLKHLVDSISPTS